MTAAQVYPVPDLRPGQTRERTSMWLIGLELGIAAVLLVIVAVALRAPKDNDSETPPHD